jgi:hypothetical protein
VGDEIVFTAIVPVGDEATGEERLEAYGLELLFEDDKVLIDNAVFDSPAQAAGLDFDQQILTVLVPADQPPKELLYIPAIILVTSIFLMQRRRQRLVPSSTATV